MVDRGALELQGNGRVQRLEAAARTTDDALRNRLVLPVGGRHDFALFPEQAADRTDAAFPAGEPRGDAHGVRQYDSVDDDVRYAHRCRA